MEIRKVPISQVVPWDKNPRGIKTQDYERLKRQILKLGIYKPLVCSWENGKYVVLGGNMRIRVLKELGVKEVEISVVKPKSEAQKIEYALSDNDRAGYYEEEKLAELIFPYMAKLELDDFKVDIDRAVELKSLLEDFGPDFDEKANVIPEIDNSPAKTKRGQFFQLGRHRLMCGDSGVDDDVNRLLSGATIHLVNTDPPYNVKLEPRSNTAVALAQVTGEIQHHQAMGIALNPKLKKIPSNIKVRPKDRPLENDYVSEAKFNELLRVWFKNIARVLLPGHSFYIWGGFANIGNYPPALKENGLYFSQAIIWVKEHPVLTRKDFMGNHEWCFYGWREGAAHRFFGPPNVGDVWSIKKVPPTKMIHLTEKPVELAERAIEFSSKKGENVLDLFGGSGSTLIAAEKTNRCCFMMEIDPKYCDVIIERFSQFSGISEKEIRKTLKTK
jgi:DNA modification methylase